MRSMTGFGKTSSVIGGKLFNIELRSLNGKYLDLNVKIPNALRETEIEIRNLLSEKLLRGKAELLIEPVTGEQPLYSINRKTFRHYYEELESLTEEIGTSGTNLVDAVMRIPDVISSGTEKLNDDDYNVLFQSIGKAFTALDEFRRREGQKLKKDILLRIGKIKALCHDVQQTEGRRKELIRERLKQKLGDLLASTDIDQSRLEQEVLYYAERLDITEELVRLDNHCDHFAETSDEKETSKGKKLGFIAQEMGREINTLGAKANDSAIQKNVVEMKEELEKIKEQLNNVL